ncbi:hypothetical protein Q3W71_10485 [Micromonospora sp. C28SCA-DRY-2]|uniref:hypothetical protein n=1 Tax=Micromonospora sp. C28SCA-DRY-2 TaxID=3059522 RepID=UPI0026746174|nr:hypothetical protein [Micromonospora sp. C28SCA-DRY-2]MDO3702104.1 hypothetical protein [Micromonospora sp. C28SCA-DRY-2]
MTDRCAEVEAAVRAHDSARMTEAVPRLWEAAQQATPAELDETLSRCVALLPELGISAGGQFAVLCGALVELGARPDPLVRAVADGLLDALTEAERFRAGWERVHPDEELPEPGDPAALEPAVAAMTAAGDDEGGALRAALGWLSAGNWAMPATTLLQHSTALRETFPHRARLRELGSGLADVRGDLDCMLGLLRLLDAERLLVLHRETGRGWWVTVDGVGDNFQLHTLLAAALAEPGRIEGLTVDPAWVAVATDAPPERFGGLVTGSFNLVDGHGAWIWNEGLPADIPLLDGVRVVVLDPPSYTRSWENVRRYPTVRGSLAVDGELGAADAAAWLARVAPAGNPPGD